MDCRGAFIAFPKGFNLMLYCSVMNMHGLHFLQMWGVIKMSAWFFQGICRGEALFCFLSRIN